MAIPKFLSNFTSYMFKNYSQDEGKLLIHMGAAGWVLSSIAQIGMLWGDKNIDKKQKKFLLPQESADAAVNVVMYYSICDLIKKGGDYIVEKGHFVTDKVVDALLKIKPEAHPEIKPENWKSLFTKNELKGKISKLLEDPEKLNIAKNLSTSQLNTLKDTAKTALETFETHKNNVGIISAIAASVIACNIVTPYIRNKVASKVQKKLQHSEDVEIRKQQITSNITMKNPLPTSFKSFNNYNSFSGIKI